MVLIMMWCFDNHILYQTQVQSEKMAWLQQRLDRAEGLIMQWNAWGGASSEAGEEGFEGEVDEPEKKKARAE